MINYPLFIKRYCIAVYLLCFSSLAFAQVENISVDQVSDFLEKEVIVTGKVANVGNNAKCQIAKGGELANKITYFLNLDDHKTASLLLFFQRLLGISIPDSSI